MPGAFKLVHLQPTKFHNFPDLTEALSSAMSRVTQDIDSEGDTDILDMDMDLDDD